MFLFKIKLVQFGIGQLPHDLAVLQYYTSTENILSKKITLALFQRFERRRDPELCLGIDSRIRNEVRI